MRRLDCGKQRSWKVSSVLFLSHHHSCPSNVPEGDSAEQDICWVCAPLLQTFRVWALEENNYGKAASKRNKWVTITIKVFGESSPLSFAVLILLGNKRSSSGAVNVVCLLVTPTRTPFMPPNERNKSKSGVNMFGPSWWYFPPFSPFHC